VNMLLSRLWVRLTLVLIAVTLIGAGIVTAIAFRSAEAQIAALAAQQRIAAQQDLLAELGALYTAKGSWVGADEILLAYLPRAGAPRRGPLGRERRRAYVLADADGNVVFDSDAPRTGIPMRAEERDFALPVRSADRTVGYLLAITPADVALIEGQFAFVASIRRNLIWAGLLGSAIAVLIGLAASRWLTRPLNALAQAARGFSRREWHQRVAMSGTQEIDAAAHAFNDMAASLQQAEVNRRNLTADIAHELRTPLTVMQGNLRAMLDGVYPLERAEVSTVYDETRLLSRLVDDLRELALAEAGKLNLTSTSIDVASTIRAAVEPLQPLSDERGVTLTADLAADLPAVMADADRLRQVLHNLLTNALRHTPDGGRVTARVRRAGAAVRVEIEDTGEGIDPADLPHLFDRFFRSDKARTRATGGSGLGLAISKALVEAMGGEIGVESAVGSGSRFWFTLPGLL
jgi:two-component system, OmpR family, sensor kinase